MSPWLAGVRRIDSPNQNDRPSQDIDLLVIHNISLPPRQFGGPHVEHFFCNRLDAGAHPYFREIAHLKVSSHLLIDRAGNVTQFVPFDRRAWHAGESEYQGRKSCNDFSIGIELEGADDIPFTDAQYFTLARVTRELLEKYPSLSPEKIVGHSDITPGRKTDPGPSFDWARYRELLAPKKRRWMKIATREITTSKSLSFKNAELGDAPDLAVLLDRAYTGTIDHEGETPEQCLKEIEDTLSGKYGLFLDFASFLIPGKSASLITLWKEKPLIAFTMTAPESRNQGLGGFLIERSISALAQNGYPELYLVVTEGNEAAQRLYTHLGFQDLGPALPMQPPPV
jgi:AmpD protein